MENINKVAIITGASHGIGKAIAIKFAAKGNKTVLVSRSKEELQIVCDEIKNSKGNCLAIAADVSKESDVKKVFKDTIKNYNRLDILINCAGIGKFNPISDLIFEDWKKILDVNLTGTFLCSREAARIMIPQKSGHIINFGSDQSRYTFKTCGAYGSSKFGVRAFTDILSKELIEHNIKVTLIMPGGTDSNFGGNPEGKEGKEHFLRTNDVADVVMFILERPKNVVIDEIMFYSIEAPYKI